MIKVFDDLANAMRLGIDFDERDGPEACLAFLDEAIPGFDMLVYDWALKQAERASEEWQEKHRTLAVSESRLRNEIEDLTEELRISRTAFNTLLPEAIKRSSDD